jgi:hypothetical protein
LNAEKAKPSAMLLEAEVLLHNRRCRRQVDPVDEQHEFHHAQQKHEVPRSAPVKGQPHVPSVLQ